MLNKIPKKDNILTWLKIHWWQLCIVCNLVAVLFIGIQFYKGTTDLYTFSLTKEELAEYTKDVSQACFGGTIDANRGGGRTV